MSEPYCSFEVGQKVECIAEVMIGRVACERPRMGQIYTVRNIQPFRGAIYIRLVEIINPTIQPIDGGPTEPTFAVDAFRPIVYTSTDAQVAALKRLVSDVFQKVDA